MTREEAIGHLRDMAKRHRKGRREMSADLLDRAAEMLAEPLPKTVPKEVEDEIDRSMGLQMIPLRLPIKMIEDYKLLAEIQAVVYGPSLESVAACVEASMREALATWIDSKKSEILRGVAHDRREALQYQKVGAAQ